MVVGRVVHPDRDLAVDDVEDLVRRLVKVRRDPIALATLHRECSVLVLGLIPCQQDREQLIEDERFLAFSVAENEGPRGRGQDSGEGDLVRIVRRE